jgi:hypothetical protein
MSAPKKKKKRKIKGKGKSPFKSPENHFSHRGRGSTHGLFEL